MGRLGSVFALVTCGLLSACIPPNAETSIRQSGPTPEVVADSPRIDPQMDTVFDEAPIWEMRPVIANAISVVGERYKVVSGDTLRAIGAKTGAGSEALAQANGLSSPFVLNIGQQLDVPAGRYHRVGEGETGIAIARAYGLDWAVIIADNRLEPPYTLRVGQRLRLRGDVMLPALEVRAAAFKLNIDDIVTGSEPATIADTSNTAQSKSPGSLSPTVAVVEPSRFTGGFNWPADGRVISRFGPAGEGQVNKGIDIAVAQSAPILASADGVVAFVGNDVANYGGLILIRHGDGWITAYGRATKASVTRGQQVKRGQIIGKAGTGTAPLLFFQMRKSGAPTDPLKQLPAR